MAGKPKTPAPLRRDFHDVQVTKLLGKLRKSTILKREGPGTDALWRTHIGMSSGTDGRGIKVLKAQMHEAQNLGGIRYGSSQATTIDGATIPTTIR